MNVPEVGEGLCFGIGGTNYRIAECDATGDVGASYKIPTPDNPEEFFGQAARTILDAADRGATWSVMGVPGPVSVEWDADGAVRQHMRVTNIPALRKGFDPVAEMAKADPAAGRLLETGAFTHLTVNDGDLAAQAGAKLYGTTDARKYNVVADLIDGSGTGSAVTRRDNRFPEANLFHPDPGLWEIGHNLIDSGFPGRTYERSFSGPALAQVCEVADAKDIDHSDPIWKEVGRAMGSLSLILAINGGAELVVMSGGIGIGEQKGYKDEMQRSLDLFASSHNPMADKVPDVQFVPPEMADTYEMHGARGAIVSHLTRRAIDQLVYSA
jgi:hypothetical protein